MSDTGAAAQRLIIVMLCVMLLQQQCEGELTRSVLTDIRAELRK